MKLELVETDHDRREDAANAARECLRLRKLARMLNERFGIADTKAAKEHDLIFRGMMDRPGFMEVYNG